MSLLRHLAACPGFGDLGAEDLEPLAEEGLAHRHWRLRGRGLVVRAPRLSRLDLTPADNLAYQAASFTRVSASGHAPALAAVVPVAPDLPWGALVVEEVPGRLAALPRDLPGMARALAAIHALPLPAPDQRPPLIDQTDPWGALIALITRQAGALDDPRLAPASRRILATELAHAERRRPPGPQPVTLVASDTHPGNFLHHDDGRMMVVDLERAMYGPPGVDLAHATLTTSTTWDRRVAWAPDPAAVTDFYRTWLDHVPASLAETAAPWLAPLRRLTWLRTTTWALAWRRDLATDATGPAVSHALVRVGALTAPDFVAAMAEEVARPPV